MSPVSKNDEDAVRRQWDQLIEMSLGGDGKSLNDFISLNLADELWREAAIGHLIRTCGHISETATAEKIWALVNISILDTPKQTESLIRFFENKWAELCGITEKPSDERKASNINESGTGLLTLLAHLRTEKAVKYLEEIVARSENCSWQSVAIEFLSLARRLASIR
jgi:hypothetical protein